MPITPKYHRLYTALRRDIAAGKLPPNAQLPTEEMLCRTHDVSRGTVRKALDALAAEGLITREQGRGVFVNPPRLELLPFTLADPAPTLRLRTLSAVIQPADEAAATRLDLAINTPVIVLMQTRSSDGEVMMSERRVLPQALAPDLITAHDLDAQPVHWLLTHHYGAALVRATYSLEARPLTPAEADLLGVDAGTPAFALDRLTYTTGGAGARPAVWYQALYRMDYPPFRDGFQGIM
jgi:GntR family transcriptional regulator